MIPTIETIVEDLVSGKITKQQAIAWLHQHAESAVRDLRDDFAACALQGFMSQSHEGPKDWTHMGHGWGEDCANKLNCHEHATAHTLAGFAYTVADAMLKARES